MSHTAAQMVMVEPAPFEAGVDNQWSEFSTSHGLKKSDIMTRQRYFENSRSFVHYMHTLVEHVLSENEDANSRTPIKALITNQDT